MDFLEIIILLSKMVKSNILQEFKHLRLFAIGKIILFKI